MSDSVTLPALPITVTLEDPLMHGRETVRELVFTRKPEVGDFEGVDMARMDLVDIVTVAGRMAGYPPSVMKRMSLDDFEKVSEVLEPFLFRGPRTGKTP